MKNMTVLELSKWLEEKGLKDIKEAFAEEYEHCVVNQSIIEGWVTGNERRKPFSFVLGLVWDGSFKGIRYWAESCDAVWEKCHE